MLWCLIMLLLALLLDFIWMLFVWLGIAMRETLLLFVGVEESERVSFIIFYYIIFRPHSHIHFSSISFITQSLYTMTL